MALMMPACSSGAYGGYGNLSSGQRRSRSGSLAVNSIHSLSARRKSSLTPELAQFVYHNQQSAGRKQSAIPGLAINAHKPEDPKTMKEKAKLLSEVLNFDFDPINLRTVTVDETFRKMEVSN